MAVRRTAASRRDDEHADEGSDSAAEEAVNEVRLAGRVPAAPVHRELPSGDEVVTFRVVVTRPARASASARSSVDTIDCAAWSARARRVAAGLGAGERVTVTGALRRRFWRSAGGPASRTEVEVATIRVDRRACASPAVSRRRAGA